MYMSAGKMADRAMPVIDPTKCNGCGLCVSVCRCGVLVMVNNVATLIEVETSTSCTQWCTQCELVCETGAITCPFEIIG